MSEVLETIRIERPDDGIMTVRLARPEVHNAQNPTMLYEINDALHDAGHDPDVKVVILAADGDNFSSGHDLGDLTWADPPHPVSCWGGYKQPGAEGYMAVEE